jgi:hypothetical protein
VILCAAAAGAVVGVGAYALGRVVANAFEGRPLLSNLSWEEAAQAAAVGAVTATFGLGAPLVAKILLNAGVSAMSEEIRQLATNTSNPRRMVAAVVVGAVSGLYPDQGAAQFVYGFGLGVISAFAGDVANPPQQSAAGAAPRTSPQGAPSGSGK